MRTLLISAVLLGGVAMAGSPVASSQQPVAGLTQPQPAAGNPTSPAPADSRWIGLWDAQIAIVNQPLQRARFITANGCGWGVLESGKETGFYTGPTFDGEVLRGELLGFATPREWREELAMSVAADGKSADGTLTNGGWRELTGPMTWIRVFPIVELIATAEHTANEVVIAVRGSNLPYAGPGPLARCGDVFFDEPGMRFRTATAMGNKDGKAVNYHVMVDPGVPRGMKNLRLNGVSMRWNYRGPVTLSTLQFVEADGEGRGLPITEVVHTSPFFLEAAYSAVPTANEIVANVTWSGGAIQVPLTRTARDVKVFRSRPLEFPKEFTTAAEGAIEAAFQDKRASVRVPPASAIAGVAFRDHLGNILVERVENGVLKPPQIQVLEPVTGMVRYETAPKSDTQTVTMFANQTPQTMTATRTSDPLLFETLSRRAPEGVQTVALVAHGYAAAIDVVPPRIEVVVRRQEDRGTRESVPSLLVDEQFHVDVMVPPQQAAAIGETLVVNFRTKGKGGTSSLRLRGQRSQRGHTVYTHSDAVTLEGGGQGEGRTLNWIVDGLTPNGLQNLITGYDMRRLKSDKADVMVVSYGDAKAEVAVYWSWRQKKLAEIDNAMQFLRQFYANGMQTPGVTRDGLEQLTRRLNLIKNYDRIMEYQGEDFNDIQRVLVASAYFDMLEKDLPSWDPDYIPTNYRGSTNGRFGVLIGSRLEGEVLNTVVERAKAEYQELFVRSMRDITVGTYQFVASATGVNQVLMVATGKDAMNRRVSNMERWLAGIDLVSQAAMLGAGTLKAGEVQRQGAGGLDRARFVTDVRAKMPDNIAADLIHGRTPSTAPRATPRPPSVPADLRDRPTEVDFRERPTEIDFRERTTEALTEPNPAPRPSPSNTQPRPAPDVTPANPSAADGVTVLSPSDSRDLRSAAMRAKLERLGVTDGSLSVNADIQANNGLSATDGAVVLAERYGVSPSKLIREGGIPSPEIARALDDYYRAAGIAEASRRKVLVQRYLGTESPAGLDAIVARDTRVAPRRPAPPDTPVPTNPDPGTDTVRTDRVVTLPDENATVRTDRVLLEPETPDPSNVFQARPNAHVPPVSAARITPKPGVVASEPDFRPPSEKRRPQAWTSPDNRRFELDEIAQGLNADVYGITKGDRAGHVLKTFPRPDKKGISLDRGGNEVYHDSSSREMAQDVVHGAELLAAQKLPHKRVIEALVDGPTPYIIQERLRTSGNPERVVKDIGQLTKGQQQAIVDYYDRIARADLIMEDAHAGNLYLRQTGPDIWEAGLLDTDRIAKFGQIPSQRLSHLMKQPVEGLNRVPTLQTREGLIWTPANAREYLTKMFEHNKWIKYENGQFVPGLLDPKIVSEKFDLNVGPPPPPARQPVRDESGAELDGFRQVLVPHLLVAGQVGDRTGHAPYPIH